MGTANTTRNDRSALVRGRFLDAELVGMAHEVQLQAGNVVLLANLANEDQLVLADFRKGPIGDALAPIVRVGAQAVLVVVIPVESRHVLRRPTSLQGFFQVAHVMAVIQSMRDEGSNADLATVLDKRANDVAAIQ